MISEDMYRQYRTADESSTQGFAGDRQGSKPAMTFPLGLACAPVRRYCPEYLHIIMDSVPPVMKMLNFFISSVIPRYNRDRGMYDYS